MQDDKHKGEGQTASPAKKIPGRDSRRDRLKLALRENLKRRKSQAKGRSETAVRNDDKPPQDSNRNEADQ